MQIGPLVAKLARKPSKVDHSNQKDSKDYMVILNNSNIILSLDEKCWCKVLIDEKCDLLFTIKKHPVRNKFQVPI